MKGQRWIPGGSVTNLTIIQEAAEILRQGGLVAFPTETVYGLGGNGLSETSVRAIYTAKGRPVINPVILHVSDWLMARQLVKHWPAAAEVLTRRYWPGPLTIVLERSAIVPNIVTAGGETVGLRMPAHPIARQLIEACGFPLAGPSANPSNYLSPTTADHVLDGLGHLIDGIIDGGATTQGIESTVIDLTNEAQPRLLRPGPISLADLQAVFPADWQHNPSKSPPTTLRSPGLLAKHYSPHTPAKLASLEAFLQTTTDSGAIVVCRDCDAAALLQAGWQVAKLPDGPEGYAQELYAILHTLDKHQYKWMGIVDVPDTPAWAGVRDRLQRACHRAEKID